MATNEYDKRTISLAVEMDAMLKAAWDAGYAVQERHYSEGERHALRGLYLDAIVAKWRAGGFDV
jgi:hypothetical protein